MLFPLYKSQIFIHSFEIVFSTDRNQYNFIHIPNIYPPIHLYIYLFTQCNIKLYINLKEQCNLLFITILVLKIIIQLFLQIASVTVLHSENCVEFYLHTTLQSYGNCFYLFYIFLILFLYIIIAFTVKVKNIRPGQLTTYIQVL